jgi:phosphatidate cytidylyltransferase
MRFACAIGATAPVSADTQRRRGANLVIRTLSALVLAPLVLIAIWLGSPWFDITVAVMAALLAREWGRIADGGRLGRVTVALAVAAVVVVAIVALGGPAWVALLVAGAATLPLYLFARASGCAAPLWLSAGLVAVAVPCLALDWLRADPAHGAETIFWLVAVVWATDTGAYAAGRLVGGPKLAPQISPNKTWAGLAGGAVAAGLVGAYAAVLLDAPSFVFPIGLSVGLALVAQAGDLGESYLKRHFGVKDSGRLIPGHGGLLDRVDGLLTVAPTVAAIMWATGGILPLWGGG